MVHLIKKTTINKQQNQFPWFPEVIKSFSSFWRYKVTQPVILMKWLIKRILLLRWISFKLLFNMSSMFCKFNQFRFLFFQRDIDSNYILSIGIKTIESMKKVFIDINTNNTDVSLSYILPLSSLIKIYGNFTFFTR